MPPNLSNAQDLVAIEAIRDDTVVMKGGSLRQVLMVGGVNFSLKSETEQNIITQTYQNFLNSIDFPLEIIVHSRKINIERYLASLDERRAQEPSPLLQSQIAEYSEFIKKFVSENEIMAKTFLVVVPFSAVSLPRAESFARFNPFRKKTAAAEERAHQATEADFAHNVGQLKQRVARVQEGLLAIGLETKILGNQELVELFYNFYNPETVEKERLAVPGGKTEK
jgi:type IV secretory pathway VirB4 component